MKKTYHSALQGDLEVKPLERFNYGRSVAFVHDMNNALPKEYAKCDAFYAEPPWRAGFDLFNKRAGKTALTYNYFVEQIGKSLKKFKIPQYIVTGKHALNLYPKPWQTKDIILNGAKAKLLIYNSQIDFEPTTTDALLSDYIAKKYKCVGDFCCGYGLTGLAMAKEGKDWVLSDHNAKCVGYIAKTFAELATKEERQSSPHSAGK